MNCYKDVKVGGIYDTTNHGPLEVLKINGSQDVDVRFVNTGYTTKAELGQIRRGSIKDWSAHLSRNIGKLYPTISYGDVEILEYKDSKNILVRFVNTGFEGWYPAGNILKGKIMDYIAPAMAGVGYMGVGPHSSTNQPKAFKAWAHMLQRCYIDKEEYKNYGDKFVNISWYNFQTFTDWCLTQVGFDQDGWQLDKDILVQGNKEYGPETCCFVPARINSLVIKSDAQGKAVDRFGTIYFTLRDSSGNRISKGFKNREEGLSWYRAERELIIKNVAEEYKNVLDDRVYNALCSWKVGYQED